MKSTLKTGLCVPGLPSRVSSRAPQLSPVNSPRPHDTDRKCSIDELATCAELYQIVTIDRVRARAHYEGLLAQLNAEVVEGQYVNA